MTYPRRLTDLQINGFRSLRHAYWTPGSLNVVIGPNASGKSNLLKCLRFLVAAARAEMRHYVAAAGGMGSLVYKGIATDIAVFAAGRAEEPDASLCEYELGLMRLGQGPQFQIDQESWIFRPRPEEPVVASYTRQGGALVNTMGFPEDVAANLTRALASAETLLSFAASPFVPAPLLHETQAWISSWLILDEFSTGTQSPVRNPVTTRHDTRLLGDGSNLTEVLHTHYETNGEFRDKVDEAMRAAFGHESYTRLVFPPVADHKVLLGVLWSRYSTLAHTAPDLSDGTLRFLLIIAALSLPEPYLPALVAIDEPENGLHPSMMRIIAEYAEDAALRSQIVFTTHSAEFLDGFRMENPPTTTVVAMDQGETSLRVVDASHLARWLEDYTLGSLYRSTELEQMRAASQAVRLS